MNRDPKRAAAEAVRRLAPELNRARGEKVLIALSGGADSTALADMVLLAAPELGLTGVELLHIDHRLRPESTREAELLVSRFRERGAVVTVVPLDPAEKTVGSAGVERWGRGERYRILEEVRVARGCGWILTGHHRDDQAETVVMRLERGCGFAGLVGVVKCDPKRRLLRPVLGLSGAELRRWCLDRGLSWIEDGSNRDYRFARNEIRGRILPAWERRSPGVAHRLTGIAGEAGRLLPLIKRRAVAIYPVLPEAPGAAAAFRVDPEDFAVDEGSLFRLAVDAVAEGRGWPSIDSKRWDRMVRAVIGRGEFSEMLSQEIGLEVAQTREGGEVRFVERNTGNSEENKDG